MSSSPFPTIAFIGGGNMASALIGGLRRQGHPAEALIVIEPHAPQRERLAAEHGLQPLAAPGPVLAAAQTVVWAVKPQVFAEAAAPCRAQVAGALQLSVMAGIRSETLVAATGSARVVRAMPNTPALIGQGMAGLYARPAVSAAERTAIEALLAPTGQTLWVAQEAQLDAVTALSGSGPAYVFLILEALIAGGVAVGLDAAQARTLALQTLAGATALAAQSDESPAVLRERVTSKGGTTFAALEVMRAEGLPATLVRAVQAAAARAEELGRPAA